MENNDCTRLSSESLSGEQVDLQGNECALKSQDPDKDEDMTEDQKLGMEFSSHESAYVAYVKYGVEHGFDVRKHHRVTNKMGHVSRVTYCCSKEGHQRKDKRRDIVSYSQPISRVGCEAQMVCRLMKNDKYKIISFNENHDLSCFFDSYEGVLANQRDKELQADFKMMQTIPSLVINVEMLQHAVEVYTPEVFRLFEKEYLDIVNCSVYKIGKSGTTSEYKVSYRSQEHLVKYDGLTQAVSCSCMKFTFVGILCSHALKVLDKKNVKTIPPDFILKRWTRGARDRNLTSYHGIETSDNPKESIVKRYSHLCRNFREIASFATEDERLTAYAHDWFVQLLKSLEEMKKNLGLDNIHVHKIQKAKRYLEKVVEVRR